VAIMVRTMAARCPGCRTSLRIPADWLGDLVRCKRCGTLVVRTGGPMGGVSPLSEPAVGGSRWLSSRTAFLGVWLLGMVAILGIALWQGRQGGPPPEVGVAVVSPLPALELAPPAEMAPPAMEPPPMPVPPPPARPPVRPVAPARPQPPPTPVPAAGPVPRRALAISINQYLFANPVSAGSPGRETLTVLDYFFSGLQIARDQVTVISDSGPNPIAPLRPVIEDTVQRFLAGCRRQDRIVLAYVGHLIEVEGRPYLVPLEGEPAAPPTLIPLSWLYDQLARCRARQKVLLLDVCRLDAERGVERVGVEPLTPALAAAIAEPPPGVQVWSACGPGQYSLEIQNGPVYGGAFLNQLYEAMLRYRQIVPSAPRPEDSLPILPLAGAVNNPTRDLVQRLYGLEQLPRVFGFEAENGALYDKDEPLPPPVVPSLPPPTDPPADPELVRGILAGLDLPPVKLTREASRRLRPEGLPGFHAADLAGYTTDDRLNAFRTAVTQAREALTTATLDRQLPYQFFIASRGRETPEAIFKQRLLDEGKSVARLLLPLTEALQQLRDVAEFRDREPRRWQADHDYVLARLLQQLAFLYEYQFHLGQMRQELPPRDPATHQGWQLAAQEKMQATDREYKQMAAEAKKLLERLIEEHPGTPWALLARRDRLNYLGLEPFAVRGPR
jgi:predicted Zn finger-like uncharacterized protein